MGLLTPNQETSRKGLALQPGLCSCPARSSVCIVQSRAALSRVHGPLGPCRDLVSASLQPSPNFITGDTKKPWDHMKTARPLGPNGNPLWSLERVIKAKTMQIDEKNPTPLHCESHSPLLWTTRLPPTCLCAPGCQQESCELRVPDQPDSVRASGAGGAPGGSLAETPALPKGGSVSIRMWCLIARLPS